VGSDVLKVGEKWCGKHTARECIVLVLIESGAGFPP
jgi:hypothetical protein